MKKMENEKQNIRKEITAILFATVLALVLAMSFPMIVSADYIDTTGPTGEYYQYASFTVGDGSGYLGGGDVDSCGDLIYVNRDGDHLDVYQVTLLDSDGDGFYEPDQHPDNPDATGAMEQRTLTYLRTYDVPHLEIATVGEIYAAADRVYFLGDDKEGDIYEYVFSTGITSVVVDSSVDVTGSAYGLSQLGYDDVNDKWYAGQEVTDPNRRRVYSWDGSSWVFEFDFHSLAGGHMDGLEVVTDPNTNIPYVYVSDMTSDYLGQWRYDSATASWVEENLFEYKGTAGDVEGIGFGALGHFWATTGFASSGTVYEIGGGELGGYIPLPIELCPDEYRWGDYEWKLPNIFVTRQEVLFKNIGTGDAYAVTATVSCTPVNVVASEPDVTLGDIPAGGSAWSSDTFELEIDMDNPQDPNKGFCWTVEYDDAAGVHHVIDDVAKFCGEICSNICP